MKNRAKFHLIFLLEFDRALVAPLSREHIVYQTINLSFRLPDDHSSVF
jgi:hypothetical protein